MTISGHKTRAVFQRYSITSVEDVREAMERVSKRNASLMQVGKNQSVGAPQVIEKLEPRARVELATCRLRIGCSTTELPRL
jgi:hypothetical protein